MIPGDREYKHYDENLKQGVVIDDKTAQELETIGKQAGVVVPQAI
jgi:LDH2 family malate/lactate/ureidoglycolate dehydrogenase